MSDVASIIADLVRAGVDADLIGRTAAALASREAVIVPDEAAERRRQLDRERKRLRNSAELCGIPPVSPSPKESPQTPKETPPSTPTTHKENPLRGQKKASRLPADWALPDDWRADALAAGLPENRIGLEASKIADWSRSSKNGAKLDWRATWRNWCREAAARIPQPRGSPAMSKAPSQAAIFAMIGRNFADGQEREVGSDIRAPVPRLSAVVGG